MSQFWFSLTESYHATKFVCYCFTYVNRRNITQSFKRDIYQVFIYNIIFSFFCLINFYSNYIYICIIIYNYVCNGPNWTDHNLSIFIILKLKNLKIFIIYILYTIICMYIYIIITTIQFIFNCLYLFITYNLWQSIVLYPSIVHNVDVHMILWYTIFWCR